MAAAPHARQTSVGGPRGRAGEPATVAFRRPSDVRNSAATGRDDPHFTLPIVLRVPDLNQPEQSPAASLLGSGNPLVGKLMWGATGVLAIVAVWLVFTGKPDNAPALPAAPQWNAPQRPASVTLSPEPSPAHQPIPNWKVAPGAGTNQSESPDQHGPWRAEVQPMQPGTAPEVESGAVETAPAPRSASWPGDSWPGRGADAEAPQEPTYAPPANDYNPTPADPPAASPPATPADPWAGDPRWPDDARHGAADPASVRTARRPAAPGNSAPNNYAPNNYAPSNYGPSNYGPGNSAPGNYAPVNDGSGSSQSPRQPQARLEGGIQNMDVGFQP